MSESLAHYRLVNALEQYILINILPTTRGVLLKDLQYKCSADLPPLINGFRPDVYAKNPPPHKCIIGEAKTRDDLERAHTEDQLTAFLSYCEHSANTTLMLAVPWDSVRLAKFIIRRISKSKGIKDTEVSILEKLHG